jgi:hypothetical protein
MKNFIPYDSKVYHAGQRAILFIYIKNNKIHKTSTSDSL